MTRPLSTLADIPLSWGHFAVPCWLHALPPFRAEPAPSHDGDARARE